MELIELDATAQRALELLTNAGMSDGSIYDYAKTLSNSWARGEITGEQMKAALLASHRKMAVQVQSHT